MPATTPTTASRTTMSTTKITDRRVTGNSTAYSCASKKGGGAFCNKTLNTLNAFSQKCPKIFWRGGGGDKNVHGDFSDGTQGICVNYITSSSRPGSRVHFKVNFEIYKYIYLTLYNCPFI